MLGHKLINVQLLVYLVLGGLLLTTCEIFVVTPFHEGSMCTSNDSSSTNQSLNCYYEDQNFLQHANITMVFLKGSHIGNGAKTILLQQVREFNMVGESGTNITSLHIVLSNNYCYYYDDDDDHVCIMIENVELTNGSFSNSNGYGYGGTMIINNSSFYDSAIKLSTQVNVSNSSFQSTNISLYSAAMKISGEVRMIMFESSLQLLNNAELKFADNAKLKFCRNMICNEPGNLIWDAPDRWIYISSSNESYSDVKISNHCPFGYCRLTNCDTYYTPTSDMCSKTLNNQCKNYREGQLCGGCQDNYSLGIGFSGCLECRNDDNLALIILFVAMGPILTLAISVLNLTVSQGLINGMIFYANIIWTYKVFFIIDDEDISEYYYISNKYYHIIYNPAYVILAWLNLDFGIPTCFFQLLNAPMKVSFEFLFPLYIAGLFFIGLRYSTKLSKLLGSRSVPTLATLLFLSYAKLLRTIITCLQLATYTHYAGNEEPKDVNVWAVDGTDYFGIGEWHSYLFVTALVFLILLWVPYTLLLFLMQWLRKVDHYKLLKFIVKFKPFFDVHYAPLHDKHHYWFGLLLVVRGVLLVLSSLTLHNPYAYGLNIYFLLFVILSLLCYITIVRVYRRKVVLAFETLFLANLILFISTLMFSGESYRPNIVTSSIFCSLALLKIFIIVVMNLITSIRSFCLAKCNNVSQRDSQNKRDTEITASARFRDSILELQEALLPDVKEQS